MQLRVPDCSVAFTARSQHLYRQRLEPAFPIGTSFAQYRWASNSDRRAAISPTADSSLDSSSLEIFTRPKAQTRRLAVTSDDLELFRVPPVDFKIPCATQTPHAPPEVARVGLTAPSHVPPSVGVTMSVHKLTAGSGYDYLTRHVAALDATEKGHTGLASYYAERGETPGVWIGSGMATIDSLSAGDPVTAQQMRALFGCGLHPLAELRQQQLEGPDLTLRDFQNAARLGVPFKIVDGEISPSASSWQDASQRSRRRPACLWARRCRLLIGRACGPRWLASSFCPSMAESRWMPESWPNRSQRACGRARRRSRVMT